MDATLESVRLMPGGPVDRDAVLLRSEQFIVQLGFGPLLDASGEVVQAAGVPVYVVGVPDRLRNDANGRLVEQADQPSLVRAIRAACARDAIRCIVRLPNRTVVDVDGVTRRLTKRDEKKGRLPGTL